MRYLFLLLLLAVGLNSNAQYRDTLASSTGSSTFTNSGTSYFTANLGSYSLGKWVTFQLNVTETSGTPAGDIIVEASTQTSDSQEEGWAEVKLNNALVSDTLVDGSRNYSISLPLLTNRMRLKVVRNGTMVYTATGTVFAHK